MGAASLIGRDVRLERNASPVFAPRASLGIDNAIPSAASGTCIWALPRFAGVGLKRRSSNLSMPSNSGYPTYITYSMLAGAEAAKGNDAEAKSALAEARRLFPQLTIKWLLTETPTPSIVIDGLRKAGTTEE